MGLYVIRNVFLLQVQGSCSFEYDKMYLLMKKTKEKIYSILKEIASQMEANDLAFSVETPKDKSHGDLASNIALVLYKNLAEGQSHVARDARKASLESSVEVRSLSESRRRKSEGYKNKIKSSFSSLANGPSFASPLELAEEIVKILTTDYSLLTTDFDKIEIASPGFINFYFSGKFLSSQVQSIISQGSNYGSSEIGKGLPAGRQGKKASIEFVFANPTGPLHIGNARGGPLGDAIASVLSKAGYEVTREYLHNDVGGQVTKLGEAIYYTLNPDKKPEEEIQYKGDYIKELSEKIQKQLPKDIPKEEFVEKSGEIAVEIMLKEILEDCKLMGIKFDKIRKESDLRNEVESTLRKIQPYLKKQEGALWFAPASNAAAPDEFLKD